MKRAEAERRLAAELRSYPDGFRFFGYELSRATGVRAGRMFPALQRWLDAGYLSDGWSARHDPPRRFYVVTPLGRAMLP